MKALKKVLLGVLSLACVVTASVGLTACNNAGGTTQEQESTSGTTQEQESTSETTQEQESTSETTEEQEGTDGLEYYPVPDGYAVDQGDAMYLEEIVIPSTYKGKVVTALVDNAFSGAKVKSITIPDSVTSIGSSAFQSCSSLTSVVIPDGVTSIGNQAFYNCSSLTSVVIPDSVTSIDYQAFSSCSSLTSVVIGDSVMSIGDFAFENCSSLTSVVIPDSVTSIGNAVFSSCSSLTRVYYKGSASDWNNVYIYSLGNNYLTNATRYYYSESQPTESGNYWHYDENGEVAVC